MLATTADLLDAVSDYAAACGAALEYALLAALDLDFVPDSDRANVEARRAHAALLGRIEAFEDATGLDVKHALLLAAGRQAEIAVDLAKARVRIATEARRARPAA